MLEHVHISRSVSKLGSDIPSVSLPAVVTCRPNAPCRASCYACKGRFRFANVRDTLQNNLEIWENDPAHFEREVMIAAFHSRYFRWHSSGDIPDEKYLEMMVRIADALPGTSFLAFTKKYEMVNAYLNTYGSFPKNLRVVFSAWGSFIPDNPHNLPVAYVRLKKQACYIPEDAFQCPKYCGDCVMTGCSCWDLEQGQSVCFNEH